MSFKLLEMLHFVIFPPFSVKGEIELSQLSISPFGSLTKSKQNSLMEVNYKNTHRSGKKTQKKQCCSSLFKYPITLLQIRSPNRPILTESWQNQLFTHRPQCNTYDRLRQPRRWGQKSHGKHAALNLQCSDLCAGCHVCNPPPDPRFLQQALTFRRFLLHICPCQISMNQGRLPAGQVSHNPLQVQEQKAMRWCTGSSDLTEKKKKKSYHKGTEIA